MPERETASGPATDACAAVYLDYNATTPVRPAVRAAMLDVLAQTGNPSSVHMFGRQARQQRETARGQVAALVGVSPAQVVFTSGGTEANAQALATPEARWWVSAIEHESVRVAAAGDPDALLPVTPDGVIDLSALEARLEAAPASPCPQVALMLANNETGVIQPVAASAERVRAAGGRIHCDAIQAAGRIAVDFAALKVDSLSLSAHKLGGPQGVGALILRPDAEPPVLLRGGGQERGRRAGTENLAGIVGFGVAAVEALAALSRQHVLAGWRDALEARLQAAAPTACFFGTGAPRLPTTMCLAMPGVAATTQVMALDLAGIAVSAGAACASGSPRPSPVLRAMGVPESRAGEAIRVSFGWASTQADLERFAAAWLALYRRLAAPA